MERLSESKARSRIDSVPGWSIEHDALVRELRFRDFVEAFSFMTAVALLAERLDHHPEWSNVYDRVRIRLSTHDVGGISERDFTMAAAITAIHSRY